MDIRYVNLDTCADADGLVVVIDVLRAFSSAAYAFAAGAQSIILLSTVEEALALWDRISGALLMGEVDGLTVEGFDFSNSPTALISQTLTGKVLIQRTSAGTQGVIRSRNAEVLMAGGLCCARATVHYIQRLKPDRVTFVNTGIRTGGRGDEDAACAEYMAALLLGEDPDPGSYLQCVRLSQDGQLFSDPARPEFPASGLDYCMQVDIFDFAMVVRREAGLNRLEPVWQLK
jgi:2-phosphosulfolactate phosphatase